MSSDKAAAFRIIGESTTIEEAIKNLEEGVNDGNGYRLLEAALLRMRLPEEKENNIAILRNLITAEAVSKLPEATYWQAHLVESGSFGVLKSENSNSIAIELFRDSAERGYSQAQFRLGLAYIRGEKTEQDGDLGFQWCVKAAEQGHYRAQDFVGDAYEAGIIAPKNIALALMWHERSANQGYVDAQFKAAVKYTLGDPLIRDLRKGYFWARIASINCTAGTQEQQCALAVIHDAAGQLTLKDIEAVEKDVIGFVPNQILDDDFTHLLALLP